MRSTLNSGPSKCAFGENMTAQLTPQFQYFSGYGKLNNEVINTYTSNGTVTSAAGIVSVGINTTNGAYSIMQSKRHITYNPGQGGLARFTCAFNSGIASSTQLAGVGNSFNGFFFGYNGTTFGILRRYGGLPEIRKMTITTGATGSATVAITLNGTQITVAVTNSTTTPAFTAYQIATSGRTSFLNAGWLVENNGADIIWTNLFDGSKAGSYSVNWSYSGSSGISATTTNFTATLVAGVSATNSWITQTSWKYDSMNGLGPSKMTLDPTKLNVYQIEWQYLGAGKLFFSVEDNDSNTTGFQIVHSVDYPNTYTVPSLQNPNLRMYYGVISGGSTTSMTLNMVSFGGFTEGIIRRFEPRYAITSSKQGITTPEKTLFVLRNGNLFNNVFNCSEILLTSLSVATYNGSTNITLKLYLANSGTTTYGTSNSDYVNFANVDVNNSVALYDTTNSTVANGLLIYSFTLQKADSFRLDFTNYNVFLAPGDELSLTAVTDGNAFNVNTSISWIEIQ